MPFEADWCWLILINADCCWLMLIAADAVDWCWCWAKPKPQAVTPGVIQVGAIPSSLGHFYCWLFSKFCWLALIWETKQKVTRSAISADNSFYESASSLSVWSWAILFPISFLTPRSNFDLISYFSHLPSRLQTQLLSKNSTIRWKKLLFHWRPIPNGR